MKQSKTFECACANGFTGNFCEFKNRQTTLLFVSTIAPEADVWPIFDADGYVVGTPLGKDVIEEQSGAYKSCSIMLNGEAIIFGGQQPNINRQVHCLTFIYIYCDLHPLL